MNKFRNALDDTTLGLGEKTGYRLAVAWHYSLTRRAGVRIRFFSDQRKLGRSSTGSLTQNGTVVGTLDEPRSGTRNRGLIVGLGYTFSPTRRGGCATPYGRLPAFGLLTQTPPGLIVPPSAPRSAPG